MDCANATYSPYDERAVEDHLGGRHVLGVYPLMRDDTCRFLAIDFDEENWRGDVQMVADTCRRNGIPCSVEISRSGNGAHLWIFFSEPIQAAKARSLGSSVLTLAMKEHARLSFHSYDRMFPNQDTMPKGGFGNLIALPLQVSAAHNGGSLFVDRQMQAYADQWIYLSSIQRLNEEQIDGILAELHISPLGTLRPEDDETGVKPWQRQQTEIQPADVPARVEVTIANRIYIPIQGFSSRAQNQLKRIAAFRNPQYYKKQAMRMPVWNTPRIICCAEYQGDYLVLPRGCVDDIILYGANKDTHSGIIDIAMLQSMGDADAIRPWLRDYGMVIVDECHHVPAVSFEQVLKAVQAKYVYGLTATPKRQDGHHPILHMYIGSIRYHVDAKQQAEKRPFAHLMIPRFTGTRFHLDESSKTPAIGQYYDQIMQDDLRNSLIIEDVLCCIREGRNCLLLSERTQHVRKLSELLCAQGQTVHVLLGGQTNAQMKKQMIALKNAADDQPIVICATGKFIGEGFDDSRLDTLFLTMPISWQGTLAQYVGRLHRLHEGKREVRVYDYIDNHAVMLEKMYHKRLKGYASIGYSVSADQRDAALGSDMIYDQFTFQERFLQDITRAKESVTIVSPYVTARRVKWIEAALQQCAQHRISVTVITRTPESLPVSSRRTAEMAASMLRELSVNAIFREGIHQKYAIMDGSVVWYGSINLLSFGASQESIMRLVSGSIARALQETKA